MGSPLKVESCCWFYFFVEMVELRLQRLRFQCGLQSTWLAFCSCSLSGGALLCRTAAAKASLAAVTTPATPLCAAQRFLSGVAKYTACSRTQIAGCRDCRTFLSTVAELGLRTRSCASCEHLSHYGNGSTKAGCEQRIPGKR